MIASKLLEAIVIIGDKEIKVLNTEMTIMVKWEMNLKKGIDSYTMQVSVYEVFGDFGWKQQSDNYTLTKKYEFKSDSSWSYEVLANAITFPLSPTFAIINFDKKQIKINL
jgi:hypothetical protein